MTTIAKDDYRYLILSRYAGEFRSATEETATERKTSADIVLDLRPMAEFTTDEIAEFLMVSGYSIGFDDAKPVWLMRKEEVLGLTT